MQGAKLGPGEREKLGPGEGVILLNLVDIDQTLNKFFDVYQGTYRHLPVAVKVVRGVEGWGPQVYSTFYQEIHVIR